MLRVGEPSYVVHSSEIFCSELCCSVQCMRLRTMTRRLPIDVHKTGQGKSGCLLGCDGEPEPLGHYLMYPRVFVSC